jgi:hypothetical protein
MNNENLFHLQINVVLGTFFDAFQIKLLRPHSPENHSFHFVTESFNELGSDFQESLTIWKNENCMLFHVETQDFEDV